MSHYDKQYERENIVKKIRDFKCTECEHVFEVFVLDDEKHVSCKRCSYKANRMLSAPRVSGNTVGRSPSYSNRK
jgi:putative FmdB family regulatory protein